MGSNPDFNERFLRGMDESRQRRQAEVTQRLARMRVEAVGNFDTGLPCVCGKAQVIDHATERDPDYRPRYTDVRFGPQPPDDEKIRLFRVFHKYWCDECGLEYKNSVIEGKRGYTPREKRPGFKD